MSRPASHKPYRSEQKPSPSRTLLEPHCRIVRVAPEQVRAGSVLRDLLDAGEFADVVEGFDVGGESAVEAEDLVLDDSCHGDVVEEGGEHGPDCFASEFLMAFLVEAIDLSDPA